MTFSNRTAKPLAQQPIIVLGAGIIGCAIAYKLLQDGYAVITIADNLPGSQNVYYPSQWAGASWHISKEGSEEFKHMQAITHRVWSKFRNEDGPECGVMPVHMTEYFETLPKEESSAWGGNLTHVRVINRKEQVEANNSGRPLPAPYKATIEYGSLVVDPNYHLPYIKKKLEQLGARFVQKQVQALSDLHSMFPESRIFVNASGCGSKDLLDVLDDKCFWERGQNIFYKTDKTNQCIIGHASAPKEYTYVIPRPLQGGVILGGVKQPGNL
ncbi:putative fad dependent oxidoreductase superfamily protein [Ilyonectria robusta]